MLAIVLVSHSRIQCVREIKPWPKNKVLFPYHDVKDGDFDFWNNALKESIILGHYLPGFNKPRRICCET